MKPSTEQLIADLIRATSTYCEYDNLVDLLEQAIDAITAAPIWQPIETAPKDGTRVDLWIVWGAGGVSGERIADACWKSTAPYKPAWFYYDTYHGEELPLEEDSMIRAWMPIPEGPK